MVGPGRFELPTSRLSGVRSNQLSYGPSRDASDAPGSSPGARDHIVQPGRSHRETRLTMNGKRNEDGDIPPDVLQTNQ